MNTNYSNTVETARTYYNSEDADNFYFNIWGGEDIHIGLYENEDESIFECSRKTVGEMASMLKTLNSDSRVLDIGSGFGGSARYLARTYGCEDVALNLSEVENNRNREMTKEQELEGWITVVDASFEDIPYPKESFDIIWSQDAILHSGNREKVLAEAARVLKSGGELIFTDPMMADDCPPGVLQPILDRIHLESLGSPGFYREQTERLGLSEISFVDMSEQIANHYQAVLDETEAREDELAKVVSREYLENMKKGLRHWIEGGRKNHLCWGIFHFMKK